jgi:poly(beta-D-mannuronate) lyase
MASRRAAVAAALRYAGVAATAAAAATVLGKRLAAPVKPPAVSRVGPPLPSAVLNLVPWKISLPYGADTTQVTQPALAELSDAYFRVASAVQFTVPVNGTVQAGAVYPRSELREMNSDGTEAAWSTTSGTHTMEIVQRITHLPKVKPQLIAGQIHDAAEYVLLIRLDEDKLHVVYGDQSVAVLDPHYRLSTTFTVRLAAGDGFIDVYYNNARAAHIAASRTGCYFKAGCYLQTNPSRGDAPNDYGQVEVFDLRLIHTP